MRDEFQRLPVPNPAPQMQPRATTLVNLETIFFDSGPRTRTWSLTLVGRAVQVRAQPTTWTWATGDGHTVSSSSPGRPYPATDLTHRYVRSGDYTLTLTTTWIGEFRVEGSAWQPIDGTVTRTTAVPLKVLQARPQLVAGPQG